MATKKGKAEVKEKAPARLSRSAKAETAEVSEPKLKREPKADEVDAVEEDYLQKYQYGRELPLGDTRTNPQGGKAQAMKIQLLSQPRVVVMIPVDSGSSPDVPFDVTLNGYRLSLPRNQYIEVPQQVAEVIKQSHNQTTQALDQFKVDGNKAKETALQG